MSRYRLPVDAVLLVFAAAGLRTWRGAWENVGILSVKFWYSKQEILTQGRKDSKPQSIFLASLHRGAFALKHLVPACPGQENKRDRTD